MSDKFINGVVGQDIIWRGKLWLSQKILKAVLLILIGFLMLVKYIDKLWIIWIEISRALDFLSNFNIKSITFFSQKKLISGYEEESFGKGYSKKVSLFFSPHNWNSVISRILSMIISLFLSGSSSKHSTRSSYISLISLELQKEEIEDTEGCRDQMKAFRLFVFWALLWYLCKYID